MNFKTIFGVTLLALVASVNAAPHANSLENQIASIKEECRSNNNGKAVFKLMDDNLVYACLRNYDSTRRFSIINPNNSPCFYQDNNVFCVDEQHSNIEECSKSHVKYNYEICGRYILNLMKYNGSNHSVARIRTYPNKTKIELNPRLDQEECISHNGIQLKYQNVFQYICISPANGNELGKEITVFVDGKQYYIYDDNTDIDICVQSSKNFDKERCTFLINLIAKTDNIKIKVY